MTEKNTFVFAVCGGDEHIETLNFALPYLRHFSGSDILVVTDSRRNNLKIQHDNILDVETPEDFDHHQASIYLKTGLFKIVEPEKIYCYLDSDIIAVRPDVDEIFNYKNGPVTFASDHCTMNKFSPYAVNCGCYEEKSGKKDKLEEYHDRYNSDYKQLLAKKETRNLFSELSKIKSNPIANILSIIRYLFVKIIPGMRYFRLNRSFRYDKKEKAWLNNEGEILIYDFSRNYREIEEYTGFRFKPLSKRWVDEKGKDIYDMQCGHLQVAIKSKFGLNVGKNWQHWNGGVFLFDETSKEFLESWHESTMEIFKHDAWKTRDQGTLIATAWKLGLQNQPRLPQRFNFIADFYNPKVIYDKTKGFSTDSLKTTVWPSFLHVYHEFGRKDWDMWQYIEEIDLAEK